MKHIAAAICAALCLTGAIRPAVAQDVTLVSRDKSVEVSGDLLGFDGTFYRLSTVYGELTVDGTGVLCEGPACPNLEAYVAELTFSGTPAIGRVLLPALIEGFARVSGFGADRLELAEGVIQYQLTSQAGSEPVGIFTIKQTSNDEGFADLLSNQADVAMSLRAPSDAEVAFAVEAGYGDLTHGAQHDMVAMDAIVATVDPASGLAELSMAQMQGVLNGTIENWTTLGEASDAPLQVVLNLPINDALTPLLQAFEGTDFDGVLSPGTQVLEGSTLSLDLGLASGLGDARRVVPIADECGMAFAPNAQTIKTMEYPFVLPMYLYRPMRRLPKIGQDFFDFLGGATAMRIVERAGFQANDASATRIEQLGRRLVNAVAQVEPDELPDLQRAVAALKDRRLLSLVFRFQGDDLAPTATSSLKRLVRMAESGALDGADLLFAGFGTQPGLSAKVAQAFAEAFPAEPGIVTVSAQDFGPVLPVACPLSARGQRMNTRVEIWVQ